MVMITIKRSTFLKSATILSIVVGAVTFGSAGSEPKTFDQTWSGKSATVKQGSDFTVTLTQRGGVRGTWEWGAVPSFLRLDTQAISISPPKMPGGLEKHSYHFEVIAAGEGVLNASRGPGKTFKLKIKAT